MGDDDERGLFVLNERDDVVQAVLDRGRFWSLFGLFPFGGGGRDLAQSFLLLGLCFWSMRIQKFEELSCGVLVKCILELSERRRDLQALVENLALPLELDVFWPFDKPRKVSLRLDILTDSKRFGSLFDQRVLGSLLGYCGLCTWKHCCFLRRLSEVSIRDCH